MNMSFLGCELIIHCKWKRETLELPSGINSRSARDILQWKKKNVFIKHERRLSNIQIDFKQWDDNRIASCKLK